MTTPLHRGRAAELDFCAELLRTGWEIFQPVLDANQTDLVLFHPTLGYKRLQIKHEEPGKSTAGKLANTWGRNPVFDYLLYIRSDNRRGVIFPKQICDRTNDIYTLDAKGVIKKPFRFFTFDKKKFHERLTYIISHTSELVKGFETERKKFMKSA